MNKFIASILALTLLSVSVCAAESAETGPAVEVRLPIVMYHHLSPKASLWNNYVLPVEQFEHDLQYLREKGYESVSLTQLLAWYDGELSMPEKPVMITFDDGFESTLTYALPLLEKYGYTAVIAVIGSAADLFSRQEDHMLDYSHLSWDALAELTQHGTFEVQSHTFDMHKLSPRRGCGKKSGENFNQYATALADDLALFSQRCIEYGITTCPSIAFPFGSYCSDTLKIIKDLGFRAAFTCAEKINILYGDKEELFNLCRFNRPFGKSSDSFFSTWTA